MIPLVEHETSFQGVLMTNDTFYVKVRNVGGKSWTFVSNPREGTTNRLRLHACWFSEEDATSYVASGRVATPDVEYKAVRAS